MTKPPSISDAERKIMKLLWRKSPQPAYDLIQELAEKEKWLPRTVKSLLNRLIRKKALGHKAYKNLYLYYPLVSEEECAKAESESFLKQVFDGSLAMMLVQYAKHKKLTPAEIDELKRMIEQQEKK
ncbi:MAG: beta-lactamase [Verrucomicrobiales bacterium]|nr:beta-lactamase [Verrucomicrobiales bacterium]